MFYAVLRVQAVYGRPSLFSSRQFCGCLAFTQILKCGLEGVTGPPRRSSFSQRDALALKEVGVVRFFWGNDSFP